MERLTLVLLTLLFALKAYSSPVEDKNPIFSRLLKLQPAMDRNLGMDISNEIYHCHKKTGIDKYLILAIYNQESQINQDAKNCLKGILEQDALDEIVSIIKRNTGVVLDEQQLKEDLTHIPLKVCFDLGIGQINVNTALKHPQCEDLGRLITDYKYNITCSCNVLYSFKKMYSDKEETWWTRYNASNPVKREIYRKLVMRYYPKEGEINENITQSEKTIR